MPQRSSDLQLLGLQKNDSITVDSLRKAYCVKNKRCHLDKGACKHELQKLSDAYERLREDLEKQHASDSTKQAARDSYEKKKQYYNQGHGDFVGFSRFNGWDNGFCWQHRDGHTAPGNAQEEVNADSHGYTTALMSSILQEESRSKQSQLRAEEQTRLDVARMTHFISCGDDALLFSSLKLCSNIEGVLSELFKTRPPTTPPMEMADVYSLCNSSFLLFRFRAWAWDSEHVFRSADYFSRSSNNVGSLWDAALHREDAALMSKIFDAFPERALEELSVDVFSGIAMRLQSGGGATASLLDFVAVLLKHGANAGGKIMDALEAVEINLDCKSVVKHKVSEVLTLMRRQVRKRPLENNQNGQTLPKSVRVDKQSVKIHAIIESELQDASPDEALGRDDALAVAVHASGKHYPDECVGIQAKHPTEDQPENTLTHGSGSFCHVAVQIDGMDNSRERWNDAGLDTILQFDEGPSSVDFDDGEAARPSLPAVFPLPMPVAQSSTLQVKRHFRNEYKPIVGAVFVSARLANIMDKPQLVAAFQRIYGRSVKSGNLKWIRKMVSS